MSATSSGAPVPGGAAKLVSCLLPDDGTERRLLRWLRDEKGITRANSVYCRAHSVLRQDTGRHGKLAEPSLLRLVTIVVAADEADALFDLIYQQAELQRPGRGALIMTPLTFATPFALPEGIANESGSLSAIDSAMSS